jgi:2-phosphoglycerate kinase
MRDDVGVSSDVDPPPWIVTLVCGASGVGKTSVAEPLARRYGVPLAEADDIVTALAAMTTPEQFPVLHYWDTHPEAASWAPGRIADLHLAVSETMRPGFEAVIADHVEFGAPVVLEGDYLLPDLAAGSGGRVRAVVLQEDGEQIVANFLAREPESGPQTFRAEVSDALGRELTARASAAAVPVLPVRPWADVVDRVDSALRRIAE